MVTEKDHAALHLATEVRAYNAVHHKPGTKVGEQAIYDIYMALPSELHTNGRGDEVALDKGLRALIQAVSQIQDDSSYTHPVKVAVEVAQQLLEEIS